MIRGNRTNFRNKVQSKLDSLDEQYSKQPTLRLKNQIAVLWGLLNDG